MNALLRLIRDLLSERIRVAPHMCLSCEAYATSISRSQYEHRVAEGWIRCRCGGVVTPIWTTTGDKTS